MAQEIGDCGCSGFFCDAPCCPGAANKRKLEAAEKLLATMKRSMEWLAGFPCQGAASDFDRMVADQTYEAFTEAIEAWLE